MSEKIATAFVERRAFDVLWAEKEQWRAANAALQSQLGQAHEATLLAQADAETLAGAVRAWASTHQPMECEECEDLVTLARTAHPGTPLADEVRAARAALVESGSRLTMWKARAAAAMSVLVKVSDVVDAPFTYGDTRHVFVPMKEFEALEVAWKAYVHAAAKEAGKE